jgi:hypothetical protein
VESNVHGERMPQGEATNDDAMQLQMVEETDVRDVTSVVSHR